MGRSVKVFLVTLVFFILVDYSFSNAQFPCNPSIVCAGGCQANGIDCWDIDDPVPLDNEIIFLVVIAATLGLYKLSSRTPVKE